MTAEFPSVPPQPTINPFSCNPPEQACSDTPATSDPYGNGDDYMSYRKGSTSSPNGPPLARGGRPVVNREPSTQYLSLKSIEGDGFYGGHPLRQTEVVGDSDREDGRTTPTGERKVSDAQNIERNRARSDPRKDLSDGLGHGANHRGSSAQRHGRIRGEITLDGNEAGLERRKAQQSWSQEQVREALREAKVPDGGPLTRQPHVDSD